MKSEKSFPGIWKQVCESAIGKRYPLIGAVLKVARETALGDRSPKVRYEARDWYNAVLVLGLSLLTRE